MNATQAENLRILIRHMETKVTRTLNMTYYGWCGTPACALGEASMVPELVAAGLPARLENVTAAKVLPVFGIKDSHRLFGNVHNNAAGGHVTVADLIADLSKLPGHLPVAVQVLHEAEALDDCDWMETNVVTECSFQGRYVQLVADAPLV